MVGRGEGRNEKDKEQTSRAYPSLRKLGSKRRALSYREDRENEGKPEPWGPVRV